MKSGVNWMKLILACFLTAICLMGCSNGGQDNGATENSDLDSGSATHQDSDSETETDTEPTDWGRYQFLGGLISVWGWGHQDVFVGGRNGDLYHFDGEVWTKSPIPSTGDIDDISGNSADDVWAVTNDQVKLTGLVLHYDGTIWNVVEHPSIYQNSIPAVYATHESSIYAASNYTILMEGLWPSIVHFNGVDGWLSDIGWVQLPDMKNKNLRDVWAPNDDYLATASVVLGEYVQGEWSTALKLEYRQFWGVHGDGDGTAFAVGDWGTIAKKEAEGWELITSNTTNHLRSVWVNGPDDAWVVGEETILHYNGSTWNPVTDLPVGLPKNFSDVWAEDADNVWIVGGEDAEDGFVLYYNGVDWTVSFVLP